MGTFSAKKNNLGTDGYLRVQKEAAYGTGVTNAMTFIPQLPDTSLKSSIANIENANVINSRLKQAPNAGRKVVTGELKTDIYPDQMGMLINWLLGASTNAGASVDTGYTHTWLVPLSGERIATSFTVQQAIGEALARQFVGMTCTKIVITSDNEKNQTITLSLVGKDFSTGVARASTFTYSTKTPYYFGQGLLEITPVGTTKFTQNIRSFEYTLDLGYKVDDYMIGSNTIVQPSFNTVPIQTFKCNIDADENFRDYADAKTLCNLTLTVATTQLTGAGAGVYTYAIEMPGCRLSPETEIPNGVEKITMDCEFECGYGGTTTGSAVVPVMGEIRVIDAVATYAATA